jgi:NAD(P)-dependent dehydrogenase (short-subunit alcohol dehydrogenase family)
LLPLIKLYHYSHHRQVAYAASKGAVVGMTLAMARDLAYHKIRVMTIVSAAVDYLSVTIHHGNGIVRKTYTKPFFICG